MSGSKRSQAHASPESRKKTKRDSAGLHESPEEPPTPGEQLTQKIEELDSVEKLYHDPAMKEMGHLYFFYRPKIGLTEAKKFDDVKRLYILLMPMHGKCRLLFVPKKALPSMEQHQKYFVGVDKVSDNIDDIVGMLSELTYTTKTKGERKEEKARVLGMGVYGIFHKEKTTHFAYVLDFPTEITPLHEKFRVEKEGSYIVNVKNPEDASSEFFLHTKHRPKYPEDLEKKFHGKKWTQLDPQFLDYDGTHTLWIGTTGHSITENLHELEEISRDEMQHTSSKEFIESLHLGRAKLPQDPMKGKFV